MLRLVARRGQHGGGKRYNTDALRACQGGLCRQSPRDPWVHITVNMTSDLLFAFAELRTYPTPCSLHNGRAVLVPSLLLASWPLLESQDLSCLLRDH